MTTATKRPADDTFTGPPTVRRLPWKPASSIWAYANNSRGRNVSIVAHLHDGIATFIGDTYDFREALRTTGARWNMIKKTWTWKGTDPEAFRAFCERLLDAVRKSMPRGDGSYFIVTPEVEDLILDNFNYSLVHAGPRRFYPDESCCRCGVESFGRAPDDNYYDTWHHDCWKCGKSHVD